MTDKQDTAIHRIKIEAQYTRAAWSAVSEKLREASEKIDGKIVARRVDDGAAGNDDVVVYRCTECGKTSTSVGWLHAHIERHRGIFGFQLPWRYGDFDALMEMTEVLRVDEMTEVSIENIEVKS